MYVYQKNDFTNENIPYIYIVFFMLVFFFLSDKDKGRTRKKPYVFELIYPNFKIDNQ